MARDRCVVHPVAMPVTSSDSLSPNYPKAWICPLLRFVLLVVVVPAVALLSLLVSIALWSGVTSSGGPQWPTVWQDTGWTTGAWLVGVACMIALVARPTRRRWGVWKGDRVTARGWL